MIILVTASALYLAKGQTSFIVSLDGQQVAPPGTSPARGMGTLTLNPDDSLTYNIDYIGLTADFAAAALHAPAALGSTAPPIFELANSPYTANAGSLRGTVTALTATQKNDLRNGQAYASIATAILPDGEIRGQVTQAQIGPFDLDDWPSTVDPSKEVHFVCLDPDEYFWPMGVNWFEEELEVLSGGDQITQPINIGGYKGVKLTGQYFNIVDRSYEQWADQDTIDILMQVYGDASWLAAGGNPRTFNFLIGTLPPGNQNFPVGGFLSAEIKNKQWNWVLFRIANGTRSFEGQRFVGSLAANAQGGIQFGGVNGGTIRMENVPGVIVRLVAFGEKGAFGEPAQINVFPAGAPCDLEPSTNLVWNDVNAGTEDHLQIINSTGQRVTYQENVGPANDKRRAVLALGWNMNFGITDNYLGQTCNDPSAMKICVEFYDDPQLAGLVFGPEEYATDDEGGTAVYPAERRHTLEGTDTWMHRSFTIPAVNLTGVNTAPLTGGPRLIFEGSPPFISRVELGIFRTGANSLAGLDPLPNCFEDHRICTDEYDSFAELDLGKDIRNGLDVGTSGGDQVMAVEEAGPPNDRRLAVRPDNPAGYLNVAITDNAFGPSSQDNANLAICVTYYDDPALVGETLRPQAYRTDHFGELTAASTSADIAVSLDGTDQWREAYFEIPDIKFYGANQGPQGGPRFLLSGPIYLTRVRYAVIRPCGPMAGVNQLEDCKPVVAPLLRMVQDATTVRFFWAADAVDFTLQTTSTLSPPQWAPVADAPTVQEGEYVVRQPIVSTRFFRLTK